MKISTTLFSLFLLSAVTSSYLPSATAGVVLDTDGNALQNGGGYFVLPVTEGSGGGGLVARSTSNERCPLTVAQTRDEFDKGFVTTFSSPLRISYIAEGFPLNISFNNFAVILPCVPLRSEWVIVEGLPEGEAVKLAEYKNTLNGWFAIEKAESNGYKLLFCPVLEGSTCGDIGIHVDDDGIRSLVVNKNNTPLLVQFQKFELSLQNNNNLVLPGSD